MPHPSVSAAFTTPLAELPRIRDNLRALASDVKAWLARARRAVQAMESIALALGTLEVAHARASHQAQMAVPGRPHDATSGTN